jgi:hypothetical protein
MTTGCRVPGAGCRLTLAAAIAVIVLAVPYLAGAASGGESGRAGSNIEILAFDVPQEVRVGIRFVARATIENSGSETVQNLSVAFKNGGWTVNRTTIKELAPGNSTVASVEMWTGLADGVIENYTVEAEGQSLAVSRLVLPPKDTWINIKSFEVSPKSVRPAGPTIVQEYKLALILENRGRDSGEVNLTIRCSGKGEIFREKIIVNGSSERNITIPWVYRERAPSGVGDFLIFRADLSGDWAGNRTASSSEVGVLGISSSNGRDIITLAGLIVVWIAPLVAAILMERARRKKIAKTSDRTPDIKKVGEQKI